MRVVIELSKGKLSNKSQRDGQIIKVVTSWHYTEEPSPAFKRLMALLLQPKLETDKKEGSEESLKG